MNQASQYAGPAWEPALVEQMHAMAAELLCTLTPWSVPERDYPVDAHGVVGDGVTLNTRAIQALIDRCSAEGGGVLRFQEGDYLTGTLELKSGVMLEIARGARIIGSIQLADYPERVAKRRTVMDTHMGMHQSLFFAENVERIGIRGEGEIDFRGTQDNFPGKQTTGPTPGRPFGIRVLDSAKIVLDGITLKNSACWMQNYLNCEDLILQNLKVHNHANHNNDGIDIDGCRRVIIRDCCINAEDDAMCIKGASNCPTEDVLIENCTFVSTCNAFKIGTDTQGSFRRIFARNLQLGGIPEAMYSSKGKQASTGISVMTVDGGDVEDILIRDVMIERTRAPIFVRVDDRARVMPGMPKPPVGKLRRVLIQGVRGQHNFRQGSLITGVPGARVTDLVLRDVQLDNQGGGTLEMVSQVLDEFIGAYPDAQKFNREGLPSYGFYVRHAQSVHFIDVVVMPREADARPLYCATDDCSEVFWNGSPSH